MRPQSHPPVILDSAVVLAYAVHGEHVRYTGREATYHDGQLVGPHIKRSAICRNLAEPHDFLFFYCAEDWSVRAAVGHDTFEAARAYASRMYAGIEQVLIETLHSSAAIELAVEAYWEGRRCAVCGKWPHEVDHLERKEHGWICDECG
jgi:hypothetical protein